MTVIHISSVRAKGGSTGDDKAQADGDNDEGLQGMLYCIGHGQYQVDFHVIYCMVFSAVLAVTKKTPCTLFFGYIIHPRFMNSSRDSMGLLILSGYFGSARGGYVSEGTST